MNFTRAIVRPPGENFAAGLTGASLGTPDLAAALRQHEAYCAALLTCGLELEILSADGRFPDGTFVEDTAIVTELGAVLTRPGAPSRAGEVGSVADALSGFYTDIRRIEVPGTVDGGDVCEADGHFFIALSGRTDEPGARQLARHLQALGHSASLVDIRASASLLHLKTGIAYLGEGLWAMNEAAQLELRPLARFGIRELISIPPSEDYAANCVRVNDRVLVAAGNPHTLRALDEQGLRPLPLEMSEYRKMDGGLSCLSLRF